MIFRLSSSSMEGDGEGLGEGEGEGEELIKENWVMFLSRSLLKTDSRL